MPDISSIGHGSVGPIDRTTPAAARREAPPAAPAGRPPERPGDRVELSDHARYLDHLRRLPDARHDRVEQIQSEIAQGTYATDAKLEKAIDRLIEDLS